MKNSIQFIAVLLAIILTAYNGSLFGQSSSPNNTPAAGKFLGYDAGGIDLDFKTNNINRMRLMQTSTTTINGYTINNSGFLGLSIDPNWFGQKEPYSLLHLNGGDNIGSGPISQEFGYRDWMKAGITFTHNGDLMYVGPKRNQQDITDAVISWADNAFAGEVGPDVLRFLFTDRSNGSTAISSNPLNAQDYDGVEVARMTGDAKMGVGPMWTNEFLPHRALDVIRRNDILPQFRITYQRDRNVNFGINSDFQVSAQGNLHIIPRREGAIKAVAIGFFDDPLLETDPANTDPINTTFLDVGGLTRIRQLPDSVPTSIITGYKITGANNGKMTTFSVA